MEMRGRTLPEPKVVHKHGERHIRRCTIRGSELEKGGGGIVPNGEASERRVAISYEGMERGERSRKYAAPLVELLSLPPSTGPWSQDMCCWPLLVGEQLTCGSSSAEAGASS